MNDPSFESTTDENENIRLDYLEKAAQKKLETEIHGQTKFLGSDGIIIPDTDAKGFKVTAETGGQILTAHTDSWGRFSFPSVLPSKYKITVYFPYEMIVQGSKTWNDKTGYDETRKFLFYDYDIEAREKECVYSFLVIKKPTK